MYNFRKVKNNRDIPEFQHPYFIEGKLNLIKKIQRNTYKKNPNKNINEKSILKEM